MQPIHKGCLMHFMHTHLRDGKNIKIYIQGMNMKITSFKISFAPIVYIALPRYSAFVVFILLASISDLANAYDKASSVNSNVPTIENGMSTKLIETDAWSEVVNNHKAFQDKKCDKVNEQDLFFRCLSGFEPSYFGYVSRDDEHLDGNHLEFKVSIKYPLWGSLRDIGNGEVRSHAFYFSYTGQYDFYFGSRYSAPVISRRQNPGVFYKYEFEERAEGLRSLSFGYFHESNGQEIDDKLMFDNKVEDLLSKMEDNINNQESRAFNMATDYLSRGWDYVEGRVKYTKNNNHDIFGNKRSVQTDYYFSARTYFNWQGLGFSKGREENINWLEGLDKPNEKIYDYNSFQFTVNRTVKSRECQSKRCSWLNYFADNTNWGVTITSGNKLENISYNLTLTHHIAGQFPLKLMYFNGYGENISTYQRKSNYWMLGIELW